MHLFFISGNLMSTKINHFTINKPRCLCN